MLWYKDYWNCGCSDTMLRLILVFVIKLLILHASHGFSQNILAKSRSSQFRKRRNPQIAIDYLCIQVLNLSISSSRHTNVKRNFKKSFLQQTKAITVIMGKCDQKLSTHNSWTDPIRFHWQWLGAVCTILCSPSCKISDDCYTRSLTFVDYCRGDSRWQA